MNEGLISRRYAKALLKYALEHGCDARIYSEMKTFESSFIANPDLQMLLLNPVLKTEKKVELLATAAGTTTGEEFLRFARLVIKNRRERFFRSIGLMYQKLYRELHNIAQVNIATATKLPADVMEKIEGMIKKKNEGPVEFTHEIDSSLIGGFVLQVDSMELDASINNELKQLRLKLVSSKRI